jgi:hypothetical protein
VANPLIVTNTLPVEFIAIDEAKLGEAMDLCQASHDVVLPDTVGGILANEPAFTAAQAAANRTYKAIQKLEAELDESRLTMVRQVRAVEARINEVAKAALAPLADQRARLGLKVGRADQAAQELYRKRVREAEETARVEEARRVAEAEAARAQAIAAAKAVADLDAMPGEAAAPVTADAFDGAGAAAVRPVPAAYIPPPPKAAARIARPKRVRILDATLVPKEFGGRALWVLDLKAIEDLAIRAKLKIPGVEVYEEEERAAAKGGGGPRS